MVCFFRLLVKVVFFWETIIDTEGLMRSHINENLSERYGHENLKKIIEDLEEKLKK